MIVGLKMATKLLPSLGNTANEQELNMITTNASLFVQHTSSIHKFVLPLLSKVGQSSVATKLKSLIVVANDVSKLENIT